MTAKKRTGRKPIPKGLSAKKKPKKPVKARTAVVKRANLPVPVIPQDSVAKGITHHSLPDPQEDIRLLKPIMGRPTKYKPEMCQNAERYCMLTNCTDKELAEFLEVDVATLDRWKTTYPDFCGSIKAGKTHADANVASRLYDRAVGMRVKKTHFSAYQGEVTAVDYYEELPPDVKAQSLWLRNRQGKSWKEVIPPAAVSGGVFNINIHREMRPDVQARFDKLDAEKLAAAKLLVVSEQ